MSLLTSLECQVSELVNSDACPRPTTADDAAEAGRGQDGGEQVARQRAQADLLAAGLDEGILLLSLHILVYIDNPY